MSENPFILLIGGLSELGTEAGDLLSARFPVRTAPDRSALQMVNLEDVELAVITEAANGRDRSMRPFLRDRSDVPILLLREQRTEIPRGIRLFDDASFAEPAHELAERVELLLSFRDMGRRARSLGVGPEELRTELSHHGLDAGLVGDRGLTPPGRVSVHQLVNVEGVNRQQMAICRLMGTCYGTFLHAWRPKGLSAADGHEMPPTGVLAPYCAYLASQGERCESSEYRAAMQALARGAAIESTCVGGLKLYTVPISITLGSISWPLYAASVAVGGLPSEATMVRVAERFGINSEILRQIAEESRFWFLNPDKVAEIKETFSNLAETISREISHKYSTAYQLTRRILFEHEIRRSQRLLEESHRALEESNQRLKQKNEEIYEVTHAITHDLKKPLVSMKAMIGMLQTGRLGDLSRQQLEAVGTAQEAASYMQQLVQDILEAARLDAGRAELAFGPVPLRPLLEKVANRFRFQFEERGIDFEIGSLPKALHCDESGLEKVFMNLIGNSVSYIGDGEKRIRVQGEFCNGEARITVSDTGIGIPEESVPHVFTKFRRGANVAGVRGTGLGLAIVRGVIEAHGGRVSVESREHEGTTFTLILPRRQGVPSDWPNGVSAGGR